MRNLRGPWGARQGYAGAEGGPKRSWWQSALKARQTARQLRHRAVRMGYLSQLDLLRERVEQRAQAIEAVRKRLQRSIEDPATPISPYGIQEPGYTLEEPYDIAAVTDEPISSVAEDWSYTEEENGATSRPTSKKSAKATKKRTTKRPSKRTK